MSRFGGRLPAPARGANTRTRWLVYPAMDGDVIPLVDSGAQAIVAREDRLAALFDAHQPRLYRLARRLASSSDEARDLVQETFLRVARSRDLVPSGVTSDEAWLVRILVNIARDGWRRREMQRRTVDRHHATDAAMRPSSGPEAALIAHQLVWQALQTLPPRRRAVLVLHEIEGTAVAEIAQLLGISAVTVRWHLSLGRRELARTIRKKEPS